ncbi:MAG: TfoX family protein [Alphaproteobacteria bacterium]|nr:TfoX family protein [Alphaproteobacteria bacterium]
MSRNKAIAEKIVGLLLPLGPVRARAMFGGYGLYLDGIMFALIYWDDAYFRTDAETSRAFAAAGSEQFTYQGHTRPVHMPYWTAPPGSLKGSAKLLPWAELGLAAARRAAAAKRHKARRSRRTLG